MSILIIDWIALVVIFWCRFYCWTMFLLFSVSALRISLSSFGTFFFKFDFSTMLHRFEFLFRLDRSVRVVLFGNDSILRRSIAVSPHLHHLLFRALPFPPPSLLHLVLGIVEFHFWLNPFIELICVADFVIESRFFFFVAILKTKQIRSVLPSSLSDSSVQRFPFLIGWNRLVWLFF